jgi:hypothetical protein
MEAISLWQPWASALFTQLKMHETRGWRPPAWMIGKRLAVHAAKHDTSEEREFWDALTDGERAEFARIGIRQYAELPRGCLIGTGILAGVDRTEDIRNRILSDDFMWGNWESGRFAWRFAETQRLTPTIPWSGRQSFFSVVIP